MTTKIAQQSTPEFLAFLRQEERSENTIGKYGRDIRAFLAFAGEGEMGKEMVLAWKGRLMETYAPASVNSMLAAVNCFFGWAGREEWKVKPVKIQRVIFAQKEKELTHQEYLRLVQVAQGRGNDRLALLLQTMGATGIRVSELPFITVEALHIGRVTVHSKGKSRFIFLLPELCKRLKQYCRKENIKGGMVFRTKTGKALDRSGIWKSMKALCPRANVSMMKVFPHNIRHLFARCYYAIEKDISRLADILGHSSVNTTRIYIMESGEVHEKQLGKMGMLWEGIKKPHNHYYVGRRDCWLVAIG